MAMANGNGRYHFQVKFLGIPMRYAPSRFIAAIRALWGARVRFQVLLLRHLLLQLPAN